MSRSIGTMWRRYIWFIPTSNKLYQSIVNSSFQFLMKKSITLIVRFRCLISSSEKRATIIRSLKLLFKGCHWLQIMFMFLSWTKKSIKSKKTAKKRRLMGKMTRRRRSMKRRRKRLSMKSMKIFRSMSFLSLMLTQIEEERWKNLIWVKRRPKCMIRSETASLARMLDLILALM